MAKQDYVKGPRFKLWHVGALVGTAAIALVVGAMLLQMGLLSYLFVALISGSGIYALLYYLWKLKSSGLFDLEQLAWMKLYESSFMSNLEHPVPLKTLLHERATNQHHPGDVFGITQVPCDEEYFNLVGEPDKNNRVWCFRMRLTHKKSKKDEYLALVCDSQISKESRDATGGFQFNTPILAYGHWSRYGPFYVLYNTEKELSREVSSIETIKTLEALRLTHNRLAEAIETNAKTKGEIADKREMNKEVMEVGK